MMGMTGFGRGEHEAAGVRALVDVRTVNHRFLDVDVRGFPLPAEVAAAARRRVAAVLARGKVDVTVTLEAAKDAAPASLLRLNLAPLRAMLEGMRQLGREAGVAGEPTLDHVAALPWGRALETCETVLSPEQAEAVLAALAQALSGVRATREQEGREVGADLGRRLAALRRLHAEVETATRDVPALQLERLRGRLADLLAGLQVDRVAGTGLPEERLAQEAALLADRSDVAEETTRLAAYLERVEVLLGAAEPSGKRLDFTLQEALREVNTIGSKARDADVGARVIEMKSELERMREQAANVE